MSKSKRKTSSVIVLPRELIQSPAFRDMSGTAITVYLDFRCKLKVAPIGNRSRRNGWNILNNGELVYTYEEAASRGISRPAFTRALDSLIDHGFLDITATGAGQYRVTTLYAMSDRWKKWGTDEFVEKPRRKKKPWNRQTGFQKGHEYYAPNAKI